MKITAAFISTLILLAFAAVAAHAEGVRPYISAKGAFVRQLNNVSQTNFIPGVGDEKILDQNFYDNTSGFRGAVGLEIPLNKGLSKALRAEFEYNYTGSSTISKDTHIFNGLVPVSLGLKTKINAFMFNLYYDMETKSKITPYVGGGLGFARIKEEASFSSPWWGEDRSTASFNSFAWNAGFGIGYEVLEHLTFDLGFKMFAVRASKDTAAVNVDRRYFNSELAAGLRYTF